MRKAPLSDFCEGIRAVLVDKDQAPKWQPSSLEEVTQEQVQQFFTELPASHHRGDLKI
jgi:3-hydroxyisobutyryl-CoA hydrolase